MHNESTVIQKQSSGPEIMPSIVLYHCFTEYHTVQRPCLLPNIHSATQLRDFQPSQSLFLDGQAFFLKLLQIRVENHDTFVCTLSCMFTDHIHPSRSMLLLPLKLPFYYLGLILDAELFIRTRVKGQISNPS